MAPRSTASRRRGAGAKERRGRWGWLRRHWLLVFSALSVVGLVVAVNPGKLGGVLVHVRLRPLLLMVPCTIAVYLVRAVGWHVALRRLGIAITVYRTATVMIAGQALIFLPAGDLARVKMVRDTGSSGHDAGEVTGTIAFQELLYITLMGLAVLPAIAQHPDIGGLVAVITVLQVAVFGVLLWKRGYEFAVHAVERIRLLRRFDRELHDIRPAFVHMFEARAAIPIIACNAVAVGLAFLLFELALHAVGVGNVGFAKAAFIYALGHILAAFSLLPGGIGIYEGVLTAFMALQGVPPPQGAAAALLYRGFNDIMMALLGVGAGWWLRRHWRTGASEEHADDDHRRPRRTRRHRARAPSTR